MKPLMMMLCMTIVLSACTREKYRWDPTLGRQQGYGQQGGAAGAGYRMPKPVAPVQYQQQRVVMPQGYQPSYQDNDAAYYLNPAAVQRAAPRGAVNPYAPVDEFTEPGSYLNME